MHVGVIIVIEMKEENVINIRMTMTIITEKKF